MGLARQTLRTSQDTADAGCAVGSTLPPSDHDLTVIVPAFNEVLRLPATLKGLGEYLEQWGLDFRVLVVDDGSTDGTANITAAFGERFSTLVMPQQGGKGAAVRAGMLAATGRTIAFTDADLPFRLDSLRAGYQVIEDRRAEVVFGARDLPESSTESIRSPLRTLASSGFRMVVRPLVSWEVTDTQCGLKLFSRAAAVEIFSRVSIDGFAFDAEVVWLTHRLQISFMRIPVTLVNDYSSTLSVSRHALPMLADVVKLRLRAWFAGEGQARRGHVQGSTIRPHGEDGGLHLCTLPAWPLNRQRLMLHADDYGLSVAVTEGIVEGFTKGLLTSTSWLANAPDAARAIERWQDLMRLWAKGGLPSQAARRQLGDSGSPFDLGIHLNLTQGSPLTADYPSALRTARGEFCGVFRLFQQLCIRGDRFRAAIVAELEAQIEALCGCGWRPTHLNGHQYIELLPVVTDVIPDLLKKYSIPVVRVARESGLEDSLRLRLGQLANQVLSRVKLHFAKRFERAMVQHGVPHPSAFYGTSHAGRIDLRLLHQFLRSGRRVGPAGMIEVGLHPGLSPVATADMGGVGCWRDVLAENRPRELAWLTSPELVQLLTSCGVSLGRLSDLASPAERKRDAA